MPEPFEGIEESTIFGRPECEHVLDKILCQIPEPRRSQLITGMWKRSEDAVLPVETVSTTEPDRHSQVTLTPAQQRVVECKARVIVLHGKRHSGKSYGGFAALERHAIEMAGTDYVPLGEACRQMIVAESAEHRSWLLREYMHYLIKQGWNIDINKSDVFLAHNGAFLLQARGLSTQADGGNITTGGKNFHTILQPVSVEAFLEGRNRWYAMASRVLHRNGLHVIELLDNPSVAIIDMGESL